MRSDSCVTCEHFYFIPSTSSDDGDSGGGSGGGGGDGGGGFQPATAAALNARPKIHAPTRACIGVRSCASIKKTGLLILSSGFSVVHDNDPPKRRIKFPQMKEKCARPASRIFVFPVLIGQPSVEVRYLCSSPSLSPIRVSFVSLIFVNIR